MCATAEQVSRSAAAQEHKVVVHTSQRDGSLCSRILAIGRATPACRVTQEESFRLSRYERDGARRIFLNSGIDFRHFYFEQDLRMLARLVPDVQDREVFICGPQPMMKAVAAALGALQVRESSIHYEQFA
jgi:ferredoxin-NADP reductase